MPRLYRAPSVYAVCFLLGLLLPVFALADTPVPEKQPKPKPNRAARAKNDDRAPFLPIVENPALPRVLIIGDSISIGYTLDTRELLQGKANVLRIPTNGGPTSRGVASLAEWLGKSNWDVIHFNWGLHDIKRMKDGKEDLTGEWQVPPEQYEKNLETLVQQLEATGAKLIWASTTPVPEGEAKRVPGEDRRANEIAAKIMAKHHIPIDDLYARVQPRLAEFQLPKNVHFKPEGYRFLATQVAAKIEECLPASPKQ